jgi:PAS domain S-box-containing protein
MKISDALKDEERQYEELVESLPQAVWTCTPDGMCDYANHYAREFTGVPTERLLGYRWLEFLHPEDQERARAAWMAAVRTGSAFEMDYRVRDKKGRYRWARGQGIPVHDQEGRIVKWVGIVVEIDDRKRMEEALREGEERFRLVSDAAGVLVFDIGINMDKSDPVLHFPEIKVLAVHGLRELLGYSPDEVPLTPEWMISLIHPDDVSEFVRLSQEGFKVLKDLTLHYRLRHKNGHYLNVEEFSRIVWNSNGRPVRLVGGIRDMTTRLAMEKALRESEEKFRILTESANLPIGIIQGRKFVYANSYLIKMCGYTPEEFYALDILQMVHPDFREMIADRYRRRLANDPTVPNRYEYKMITRSGEERWMDVAPVRIELKGIPSIIGNAVDVTDRKSVEAALQKAKEELETRVRERTAELQRSNEDLERFAYVASHDLQEPLRMVGLHVGQLSHIYRDTLDAKTRESIKYAVEGVTRMSRLIKDITEYSRINTEGKKPEVTEIQSVLDCALKNLKPTLEKTQAQVTHGQLPKVAVDDTQFVQVFQNLIGNALKFRKEAEPPKIHISAERRDRMWLFSVQDNGIGIEPKFFERIFVAFQRLHTNWDQYPGSGIGLAIVKRILERHGGQVCVESTPGVGTTFHFTLPALNSDIEY